MFIQHQSSPLQHASPHACTCLPVAYCLHALNQLGMTSLANEQKRNRKTKQRKMSYLPYHNARFLLPLWKSGSLPGCPVKLWCSQCCSTQHPDTLSATKVSTRPPLSVVVVCAPALF
jgi:hypothetical protein